MLIISVLRRLRSVVVALSILITSLFSAGGLPKPVVDMPAPEAGECSAYVDPFIGTGGIPWACAMLSPGATTPFGAVRLAPDTTLPGGVSLFRVGTSGYYYEHSHLLGFSHTRLSGTGARDLGNFRVTPRVGGADPCRRMSNPLAFSHDRETASPGYYAVDLTGIGCLAEMTSTAHVGVHRYTFSTPRDARLLIDATSTLPGGTADGGSVTVFPDTMELEGESRVYSDFSGRYGGLKVYFAARLDTPFKSVSTWSGGENVAGRLHAEGDDVGADLCFGNMSGRSVELKLGISFVSVENARLNLDAETSGMDFDAVRDLASDVWEDWLSRIKITSSDENIKVIFYTALYHTMIMPTNFTDVNGDYLGFDGATGTAEGFTYRTDMSLWDTFRTEHPLLILIAPEIQRDCLKSLVRMARAGGVLPRWPSGGGYTRSMFGSPADMVIAESFLKGITDFEVEEAYEYMKKTSLFAAPENTSGRDGIEAYNKYGYCPADLVTKSVSRTLEYCWADNSIALLADALGREEDAEYFKRKSLYYRNLFDDDTKYFRAKNSDGSWVTPFNPNFTTYYDDLLPVDFAQGFAEGSARQWRWSVPYDPQSLIELFGGAEYFVGELESFMSDASRTRAALDPGAGYWQGNQHDIHAPYLFNDAGRPELTQKWVRRLLAERHSTDIDGLDGNDDGGTLSAWYVLSAVGIYPVAGTDRYQIGSPCVERASVRLGDGKTLTIVAENQSAENIYVQSVTLNGKRLSSPSVTHDMISSGGTLTFVMGPSPAVV